MSDWADLLDEFANATATFEAEEVVGTTEDRHGGTIDDKDWVALHTDVDVRYEPRETSSAALQAFAAGAFGDEFSRSPRLFAPGDIGSDLDGGERVTIDYNGTEIVSRIASPDHRTLDAADEGFVVIDLEDFGD